MTSFTISNHDIETHPVHLKDDCMPDATGTVVDRMRRPSLFGASGNTLKEYHSTPESASVHPNHITFRVANLYRDKHLGNSNKHGQKDDRLFH